MLGNVREWCLDWYSTGGVYSDGGDTVEPAGPKNQVDGTKVRRGESFAIAVGNIRSARRSGYDPNGCH
jgi:formylglycine-generating enzyme required for sulfatase activity